MVNIGKVVGWVLMAGVAYGTLKADMGSIKENTTTHVTESTRIHLELDNRVDVLEKNAIAREKDVEFIKDALNRIEKKLDKGGR